MTVSATQLQRYASTLDRETPGSYFFIAFRCLKRSWSKKTGDGEGEKKKRKLTGGSEASEITPFWVEIDKAFQPISSARPLFPDAVAVHLVGGGLPAREKQRNPHTMVVCT